MRRFRQTIFLLELTALVHEKTEGHPLFVANLLQYLGERGDLAKSNGRWSLARPLSEMDLAAPESVRAMISKKIDALEPEERRALQYASVEGTEFLSTVTAKLLGVDEIDLEESLARIGKSHRLIETVAKRSYRTDRSPRAIVFHMRFIRTFFTAISSTSDA